MKQKQTLKEFYEAQIRKIDSKLPQQTMSFQELRLEKLRGAFKDKLRALEVNPGIPDSQSLFTDALDLLNSPPGISPQPPQTGPGAGMFSPDSKSGLFHPVKRMQSNPGPSLSMKQNGKIAGDEWKWNC